MVMMQGDSYLVYIEMKINDDPITPYMVEDMEVSVGDRLRYTFAENQVGYDTAKREWFFRPTQEETFGLEPDNYPVIVRVKFLSEPMRDIKGINVGRIIIVDSYSEVVL
jgi:hypothetical protein